MIDADEIDRAFVPRPRADVAFVELDGEAVILATVGDDEELFTHWLNPIGTIVWQCLDGVASLARSLSRRWSAQRPRKGATWRRSRLLAGMSTHGPVPWVSR